MKPVGDAACAAGDSKTTAMVMAARQMALVFGNDIRIGGLTYDAFVLTTAANVASRGH